MPKYKLLIIPMLLVYAVARQSVSLSPKLDALALDTAVIFEELFDPLVMELWCRGYLARA